MQDVPSYDVVFVDHLHHFTTDHVRSLGEDVGLSKEQPEVRATEREFIGSVCASLREAREALQIG